MWTEPSTPNPFMKTDSQHMTNIESAAMFSGRLHFFVRYSNLCQQEEPIHVGHPRAYSLLYISTRSEARLFPAAILFSPQAFP